MSHHHCDHYDHDHKNHDEHDDGEHAYLKQSPTWPPQINADDESLSNFHVHGVHDRDFHGYDDDRAHEASIFCHAYESVCAFYAIFYVHGHGHDHDHGHENDYVHAHALH